MTVTEQDHRRFKWMAQYTDGWIQRANGFTLTWWSKGWNAKMHTRAPYVYNKGGDLDSLNSLRNVVDLAMKEFADS